MLARAAKHETLHYSDDDPTAPVRRLLVAVLADDAEDANDVIREFSESLREYLATREERAAFRETIHSLNTLATERQLSVDVLADIALAAIEWITEPGPEGSVRVLARGSESKGRFVFFVRREGAGYRIVGISGEPSLLGLQALAALRRGDAKSAGKWLDWARDELKPAGGDDPLAGSAFPSLWSRGDAPDPMAIERAAAALVADGSAARVAVPILERARHDTVAERASAVEHALLRAYSRSQQFDALGALAKEMAPRFPKSETLFQALTLAAVRMGRRKDAVALTRERLARDPEDPVSIRALSELLAQDGEFDESDRLARRLIDSGKAEPFDYNNLAWASLAGTVSEGDIELARKAVNMSEKKSSTALNTLAALEAATGKCLDSRNAALSAMEAGGRSEPEYMDWFVFGRLFENYGEKEDARAAYGRISKVELDPGAESVYVLSRERLRLLDGGGGSLR
jgi:tetratricopeptide (TPR) repeat protein